MKRIVLAIACLVTLAGCSAQSAMLGLGIAAIVLAGVGGAMNSSSGQTYSQPSYYQTSAGYDYAAPQVSMPPQTTYQQPQAPTMVPNPSRGLVGNNGPEMVPNYGAPGMPEVGGGLSTFNPNN